MKIQTNSYYPLPFNQFAEKILKKGILMECFETVILFNFVVEQILTASKYERWREKKREV